MQYGMLLSQNVDKVLLQLLLKAALLLKIYGRFPYVKKYILIAHEFSFLLAVLLRFLYISTKAYVFFWFCLLFSKFSECFLLYVQTTKQVFSKIPTKMLLQYLLKQLLCIQLKRIATFGAKIKILCCIKTTVCTMLAHIMVILEI